MQVISCPNTSAYWATGHGENGVRNVEGKSWDKSLAVIQAFSLTINSLHAELFWGNEKVFMYLSTLCLQLLKQQNWVPKLKFLKAFLYSTLQVTLLAPNNRTCSVDLTGGASATHKRHFWAQKPYSKVYFWQKFLSQGWIFDKTHKKLSRKNGLLIRKWSVPKGMFSSKFS